eukprot:2962351-Pleurochrysis_carterae.AAC.2
MQVNHARVGDGAARTHRERDVDLALRELGEGLLDGLDRVNHRHVGLDCRVVKQPRRWQAARGSSRLPCCGAQVGRTRKHHARVPDPDPVPCELVGRHQSQGSL